MTEAQAIKGLRSAAKKRQRAEAIRREAAEDLRRLIREAQAAGVSITRIAAEAGLSRQGVYDLLAEPPSQ